MSSLVAATEGDHKRLTVKIPTDNESNIIRRLTSSKRGVDDLEHASKYEQSMETTSSIPVNGGASLMSDDPRTMVFDISSGGSQSIDLDEFMDIISIKCRNISYSIHSITLIN